MVAFNLGPLPGSSIAEAADVIASECQVRTIPQLPQRGLLDNATAHTVALMPELPIEKGPRSWRLTTRPQTLTRRMWDSNERDLDNLEELWGSAERLIFAVQGPWSLATNIELSNGHRAVTDAGALRDITEIFIGALVRHSENLRSRFGAQVEIIINEPELNPLAAGEISGTSDFDEIRPIHVKSLGERLHGVNEQLTKEGVDMVRLGLFGSRPLLEAARISQVQSVLITQKAVNSSQLLDDLGQTIARGVRIGLGCVSAGDSLDEQRLNPRAKAVSIAKLFDELALDRSHMTQVDLHPTSPKPLESLVVHAAALACAREAAHMIERDAGDL